MGFQKTKSDYFDLTTPFTPLPRHGHLSQKSPEYSAAEPFLREVLSELNAQSDFPSMRAVAGDPDAVIPPNGPDRYNDIVTELIQIPTRDGVIIELKAYKSIKVNRNAVLMYRMHGGKWCLGRHEVDGVDNVYAAINPDVVVVSVDYRFKCKNNSVRLGIDPERIIMSGGSAGGQLAASLALECLKDKITGVIAQVLHFPPTCHPKFFPRDKYEYGSYIQNHDDTVLDTLGMENAWDAYTPDAKPDYRHSPLLAQSFKGLPPTLIQCAGLDPLRDEALAYAEALKNDGVDVEVHCYAGAPHWFASIMTESPQSVQFYERYNSFLAKQTKG
ncbi:unnamed protein product [Fusarium equiseti]|uniref:Alpha/beta hydrolase fold-3 domain-containing protein n=1 Tax=Fusarium equiseti TaxID=61235 RepID=A0A8J2IXB4_FUSEQ|nr:unnamed protein product [Fusarium equiseti]